MNPARAVPAAGEFASELLASLERLAARQPIPAVRALHLPPPPAPGAPRGEFCALELDGGALGLSYVLLDDTLAELRGGAAVPALAGADALAVARRYRDGRGAERALGLAAVNAVTRWLFDRAGFVPPPSADSIAGLDPRPGDHIGLIGLFTPLMARLVASGASIIVVELREHLVGSTDGYTVTLDPEALRGCNKVLATGTLLLNDTLDPMLARCRQAERLAMIGPSLGCPPDALFERGVSLIGGSWVVERDAFVESLVCGEARSRQARKFQLTPADYPGFDALLARL
jgi:uncharacterized protein